MENKTALTAWSEQIAACRLPRWEELPDIDLYLDQVLSLLDKYLTPFAPAQEGHVVTASMINNYVKLRILPPPVKKRYSRSHLAQLVVIGLLKQVLPIPEVKALLERQPEGAGTALAYDRFCALQEKAYADMAVQAAALADAQHSGAQLAMEVATLACASKTLAGKLLEKNIPEKSAVQGQP